MTIILNFFKHLKLYLMIMILDLKLKLLLVNMVLKNFKTIATNQCFNFKSKIIINDYDFNIFLKIKIIFINYDFNDIMREKKHF